MGFRDLELFNKALLAKTAWRMLQDPNALWVRIMKGLYFPNEGFLSAKRGNKASWGWSSILEGRDLLKEDLFWKPGDGESIRIFKDKWIPTGEGFKLKDRQLNGEVERMMVKELITEGVWDFQRMGEHLNEEDKEQIRMIKLPVHQTADKPIWRKSRDGVYAVKLGNKAAREKERERMENGASGSYRPSKKFWKGLWNIRICPKFNNFLWRAGNGALATNEALHKRRCAKSPACIICKSQSESVEHLLFLCPWAAQCWYSSPLALKFDEQNMVRLDMWLEEWMEAKEGPDEYGLALFAAMCWGIWRARCKITFEHKELDTFKCVSGAIRLVREYWSAEEKRKRKIRGREQPERKMKWEKPGWGKCKVNVDATFNQRTNEAVIGVIGRDWEGRYMGGISKKRIADSAFQAECYAVREALEGVDLWGEKDVVVEMDCEELFRRLKNKRMEGCEWGSTELLQECLELLGTGRCKNWELSLVARTGNKAADFLAAEVRRGMVPQGWLSQPPPPLIQIMERDMYQGHGSMQSREGIG